MGQNQTKTTGDRVATHYGTLRVGRAVFTGGLLKGERHGHGELAFPDGRKYIGEFRNGQAHGHGTFTAANGDKYVGAFGSNMRHGKGSCVLADGAVLFSLLTLLTT